LRVLVAASMYDVSVLVDEAWDRIVTWLADNAPATAACINPPASGAAIGAAERQLGRSLPADLVRWWHRGNGAQVLIGRASLLPPFYLPCSVDHMLSQRRMWQEVYRHLNIDEAIAYDAALSAPAGSMALQFLPAFVPIAIDGAGGNLVVDLRSGPLYGCVLGFDAESGSDGPWWANVAAMLDDVADALERGTPSRFLDYVAVVREDGTLDWIRPERAGPGHAS
jgi:cell wall assembly regulator SMI1